MEEKLYIVTLKERSDLDNFYDEMESRGTRGYAPFREVDVSLRRSLSRNTHYYLTSEEANKLKLDPRVLDVSLPPEELGITLSSQGWSESGDYKKSYSPSLSEKNWGILRTLNGKNASWGSDSNITNSALLNMPLSGKGVDIIICDSGVKANHPEFLKDGVSRVQQIDWFQFNTLLTSLGDLDGQSLPSGSYSYSHAHVLNSSGHLSSHGTHVAGTAAGNTLGWARDAKIYDLPFGYPCASTINWNLLLFDYIRAFHLSKQKSSGLRRPTIVNHSWGANYSLAKTSISQISYRGVTYNGVPSDTALSSYGLPNLTTLQIPARYTPIEADISDATSDGIIQVAAAGNQYLKVDVPGGVDWDNTINGIYYNRGGYPYATGDTASNRMIAVGSFSIRSDEAKSTFSNCGPRVDVYAPGDGVQSSHLTRWGAGPRKHRVTVPSSGTYALSDFDVPELDRKSILDSRGTRHHLYKSQGTSMASPQVTGLLACLLEKYPHWTQSDTLLWLQNNSELGQMGDPTGTINPYYNLRDSTNRTLRYVHSKNYGSRESSGLLFPRRKRKIRTSEPTLPSYSMATKSIHLWPTLYNTGAHTASGHIGSDSPGSLDETYVSTRSVTLGTTTNLAFWGFYISDGREGSQYQYSWNGTSASLVPSDSQDLWYELQCTWQVSSDRSSWSDLPGENDSQIVLLCDSSVNGKYYRCKGTFDDGGTLLTGYTTIMRILCT